MFGEMLDTSPEATRLYFRKLAELTPLQRLAMLGSSSSLTRRLAEAGIRREHPAVSPQALKLRLAVRLYGREMAERAFGPAPRDAR